MNPLKAGQDHLHHLIFRKYNSVFITNLILILINLALFIFGYLTFLIIGDLFSLFLFILLFFIFLIFRNKYFKKYDQINFNVYITRLFKIIKILKET